MHEVHTGNFFTDFVSVQIISTGDTVSLLEARKTQRSMGGHQTILPWEVQLQGNLQ